MNERDKPEKPFTVSDRRHFTPEGQAREETEASEKVEEAPAAPHGEAASSGAGDPASRDEAPGRASAAGGPVDFAQFLLSLGAQAGMLLSAAADEKAKDRAGSLEGARSIISILEMLQDKTQGRRTPDEERILEGLLFELRMAFVERSRAGTP